jgi:hypothetical protein
MIMLSFTYWESSHELLEANTFDQLCHDIILIEICNANIRNLVGKNANGRKLHRVNYFYVGKCVAQ